jgi:chaperonin GroES
MRESSTAQLGRDRDPSEIRPVGKNIFVEIITEHQIGKIYLPNGKQTECREAVVVSVGPGRKHDKSGILFKPEVTPGQRVIFMEYEGYDIEMAGKEYRMIEEDKIWAIRDGEKIIPYGNRILVEPLNLTKHGVLELPQNMMHKSQLTKAKVLRVGDGARFYQTGELAPMNTAVGDTIFFNRYSGAEIDSDGKQKMRLIGDSDAVAVEEK